MTRTELTLNGDLTIYTAAGQRDALLSWVQGGAGHAVIDLAHVSDCDSAGVQLLLATQKLLAEQGDTLELRHPSPAVRDALQHYGLAADLGSLFHSGAA